LQYIRAYTVYLIETVSQRIFVLWNSKIRLLSERETEALELQKGWKSTFKRVYYRSYPYNWCVLYSKLWMWNRL